MSARLLIQGFDPAPLPVLPEGLEGEQGGQQAFNPSLRCTSSIPASADLQQEAPHTSGQAVAGHLLLQPGRIPSCLPGSPQPQEGQRVLEQPSQHDEQGGEEESHQTQPAQLLELHQRLPEPLIPPGPDGNIRTVSAGRSAAFSPVSGSS